MEPGIEETATCEDHEQRYDDQTVQKVGYQSRAVAPTVVDLVNPRGKAERLVAAQVGFEVEFEERPDTVGNRLLVIRELRPRNELTLRIPVDPAQRFEQ